LTARLQRLERICGLWESNNNRSRAVLIGNIGRRNFATCPSAAARDGQDLA
jgi:hypothetical protein